MKQVKETPTEVGTQFGAVWVYNENIWTNTFIVEGNERYNWLDVYGNTSHSDSLANLPWSIPGVEVIFIIN